MASNITGYLDFISDFTTVVVKCSSLRRDYTIPSEKTLSLPLLDPHIVRIFRVERTCYSVSKLSPAIIVILTFELLVPLTVQQQRRWTGISCIVLQGAS